MKTGYNVAILATPHGHEMAQVKGLPWHTLDHIHVTIAYETGPKAKHSSAVTQGKGPVAHGVAPSAPHRRWGTWSHTVNKRCSLAVQPQRRT